MTIPVTQEPSQYFGHINEHIELGGIYQVQFKPQKQFMLTDEERQELERGLLEIEQFAPKEA